MLSTERERLDRVEALYQVFQPYSRGPVPEGCPCCVDKTDRKKLSRVPLRELTWNDLGHFAFKAVTTWGDADSFRHYLPRILELTEFDPPWDREIILGKLRHAEWRKWPAREQYAVAEYLLVLWRRVLDSSDYEAEEFLCAFVCAECDMSPFLDAWIECRSARGYAQLSEFASHPFTSSFWGQGHKQEQEVDAWLLTRETPNRLNNIFESEPGALFADEVARAVDAIEAYQARCARI